MLVTPAGATAPSASTGAFAELAVPAPNNEPLIATVVSTDATTAAILAMMIV
jgi:hypothetical protein